MFNPPLRTLNAATPMGYARGQLKRDRNYEKRGGRRNVLRRPLNITHYLYRS
jgi:hypothetical protein